MVASNQQTKITQPTRIRKRKALTSSVAKRSKLSTMSTTAPPKYTHIDKCINRTGNNKQKRSDDPDECDCHKSRKRCSDVTCLNRALKIECPKSCKARNCANQRIAKQMYAKVHVQHTNSNKGFGLYAKKEIKAGQFITEFMGEIITEEEEFRRRKAKPGVYRYILESANLIFDATKYGNEARFINHSCAPNTRCERWIVPGRTSNIPRIAFFANTTIKAGQELTFDYKFSKKALKKCLCGEPSCKYQKN
ncbi:hypothetical protein CAEBREN_24272 [Caenorhabditis brenneri]|uniref:SET domain-containing protein n=1 Tax=Caenorhabditis brenneri TaxID=135651 RepID=G0M7I3_CAEBE|nr:hypothetical protein CAEBREN_24272 [Caenorhabditis brenneri]